MDDLKSILASISTPTAPKPHSPRVSKILRPRGLVHTCDHDHEITPWHALALCNMPESFYKKAAKLSVGECRFVQFKSEIDARVAVLRAAAGESTI